MSVTDLDLTRLEELAEKATPGPWRAVDWNDIDGWMIVDAGSTQGFYGQIAAEFRQGHDNGEADARLVAELRNAVPSLLAAARANIEVRRMAESLRDDAESQQNRVVGRALLAALGGAE